jgi:hypothetical protein
MGLKGATRRLLLPRIRAVMIGVVSVAAVLVLGTWFVDEGEIVRLTSVDAAGRDHVTELWIVDLPSGLWLRAGAPDARWLERIRANPELIVERGDQESRYRAVPEPTPERQQEVNRAMAEKYGAADRVWARIFDHRLTVPVQLLPVPDSAR